MRQFIPNCTSNKSKTVTKCFLCFVQGLTKLWKLQELSVQSLPSCVVFSTTADQNQSEVAGMTTVKNFVGKYSHLAHT